MVEITNQRGNVQKRGDNKVPLGQEEEAEGAEEEVTIHHQQMDRDLIRMPMVAVGVHHRRRRRRQRRQHLFLIKTADSTTVKEKR